MDLGLQGKACIVTGATRGIGLETARMLHAEGAHVLAVARSGEDVFHADVTDLFLEELGPDGRSVREGDRFVLLHVVTEQRSQAY